MEGETVKFGRTTFVGMKGSNLKDNYEVIKKLGKGGYGQVYQVRNKKSNELFACKKLSKLDINNLEKFEREIKILIQTDHPNIIKLYDVYTTTNSLYLIMEECHGVYGKRSS